MDLKKTETQKEDSNVNTEAEIGVVQPVAKDAFQLPGTGKGRAFRERAWPPDTLISDLWLPKLPENEFLVF